MRERAARSAARTRVGEATDPCAIAREGACLPKRLPQLGITVLSRRLATPLLAALALALSAAALSSPALAAEPCPNEALRAQDGYSLALPDCRAYEQVSPVDKQDGVVAGSGDPHAAGVAQEPVVQTSPSGNAVSYVESRSSSGNGSSFGNQYKAARTAEGWAVEDLSPTYTYGATPEFAAFSPDLASAVVESEVGLPGVEGATPQGYTEMYVRGSTGQYSPLNLTTPPDRAAFGAGGNVFSVELLGTSADLSHVVFSANDALTPATAFAPAARDPGQNGRNVYQWSGGHLSLVNVLPGNSTTDPTGLGPANIHAVSTDGSRVFWTDAVTGDLYLREDGERTVEIDASQGPGEGGRGRFLAASASGLAVFFTDESRLTASSTAAPGEPDLYEYDVENGSLTDLTVAGVGSHADVQGLLGSSEDGSYLYFVADGVLAPGASPGDCTIENPKYGQECNLYVWHAGAATKFIARISGADGGPETTTGAARLTSAEWGDWSTRLGLRTAEATPDGQYLAFMSVNRLTAYDNRDAHGLTALNSGTDGQDFEVYLYDSETGALRCASCNPTGAQPVGPSALPPTGFVHGSALTYQPNWLSENGSTLFFDSRDALSAQAVGGLPNVYEYEDSHTYLISAETTQNGAYFDDATPSGSDVFFTTGARLVGQDTDEQSDFYDARVGGGIAGQNPTVSTPCNDEACRGAASVAPALGLPISQVFSGPDNLPPVESMVATKATAKALTHAQKLAQALKNCKRDRKKSRRVACERGARTKYGSNLKTKKSKR